MKRWAVLGLAFAPVVKAGSGNVGVAEPFLYFGDVRLVGEGVRRRRRPQRMHAQPDHLGVDARGASVLAYDVAVDRAGLQVLVQRARAVVFHGAEEGAAQVPAVSRHCQVFLNQPLRHRVNGNEPDPLNLSSGERSKC